MKKLKIVRFAYTPYGTFGRYVIDGREYFTIERPWVSNLPNVSCIPEGKYDCGPTRFHRKGYNAIEILNVPNRSLIKMHKGNKLTDVKGCIAVGCDLGVVDGFWAVLNSKKAFDILMAHYGHYRNFELTITNFIDEGCHL